MIRKLDPEKRAAFLEVALKLFVENGVKDTSTAAIAREAGTAAGTLFLYFPTKQDLVDEIAIQIGEAQSVYINSVLDPTQPVKETFRTIYMGTIEWFLENPLYYRYLQLVRDSGLLGEDVEAQTAHFYVYFYQAIQRGLEEGCLHPYPLELIGNFLYQDIVAVLNLIMLPDRPSSDETYIQSGFDIFWDGIRAKTGVDGAQES